MHNRPSVVPIPPAGATDDDQDPVPIFGSWRAIYTAVLVNAAIWMALAALFSHWPF